MAANLRLSEETADALRSESERTGSVARLTLPAGVTSADLLDRDDRV